MADVVALLAERREEIRAIAKLWRELGSTLGDEAAGHVLCEAIAAEAQASGRNAAPADRENAGLQDFSRAFMNRDTDGGMGECSATIENGRLTIDLTRCDYHSLYNSSGLPQKLAGALSCGREAPFAGGYDPRLSLVSMNPPEKGKPSCRLVFEWTPDASAAEAGEKETLRVRET